MSYIEVHRELIAAARDIVLRDQPFMIFRYPRGNQQALMEMQSALEWQKSGSFNPILVPSDQTDIMPDPLYDAARSYLIAMFTAEQKTVEQSTKPKGD